MMKKWIKGFAVTGVVLLCVGTGITALAGAAGGVGIMNYYNTIPILKTARGIYWNSAFYQNDDHLDDYDDDYDDHDDDYDDNDHDANVSHDNYDTNDHNYAISSKDNMILAASYDNISSLDLKAARGIVKIVENPKLSHTINIYRKETKYSIFNHRKSTDSSKLSVEFDSSLKKRRDYPENYEEGIIEIPVGYHFREVEIEAAEAEVRIEAVRADKLSLEAAGSEIKVDSFTAGNLNAEAQAGKLTAKGEVTGNLEADAEAGQVTLILAGGKSDFNYELEASMGEIKIDGDSYSGVAYEQQIPNGATKKAELGCAMGQLDLEFYQK